MDYNLSVISPSTGHWSPFTFVFPKIRHDLRNRTSNWLQCPSITASFQFSQVKHGICLQSVSTREYYPSLVKYFLFVLLSLSCCKSFFRTRDPSNVYIHLCSWMSECRRKVGTDGLWVAFGCNAASPTHTHTHIEIIIIITGSDLAFLRSAMTDFMFM